MHMRYRNTQNFSTTAWVLQELVTGNVEFSVSLLVSRGVILDVVGMRYIYDSWLHVHDVEANPMFVLARTGRNIFGQMSRSCGEGCVKCP